MIQILTCTNIDLTCTNSCTKQKFSEASVGLYAEQKFCPEIKEIFVVPCPRHTIFKGRFRNVQIDTTCKCLVQ